MLVSFPMNRSHLPVKEREPFNKQGVNSGERSTCDPTYTDVVLRQIGSLPRCDPKDKRLIYGAADEMPTVPEKLLLSIGAGEPLVWQESKSVEFWLALIDAQSLGSNAAE